jgi:hypothetical protein
MAKPKVWTKRGKIAEIGPGLLVVTNQYGLFIEVNGSRVAQHGFPGTPQARTWVSLESGWQAVDDPDLKTIAIKHEGVRVY